MEVGKGTGGADGGLQIRPMTQRCNKRPPKFDRLLLFFTRMLKNKAHIARESIKKNQELPGPLSGSLEGGIKYFMGCLVHRELV